MVAKSRTKSCNFLHCAARGKAKAYQRPVFFKINLEHGLDLLTQAMKTRARDVLKFLIKNTEYGNKVKVSPKIISWETGIDLTHVSRYLKVLVTEGHIVRDKSDSGGDIFMISPRIGVAGDPQSEAAAKREWERLRLKCVKKRAREVRLKSSAGQD